MTVIAYDGKSLATDRQSTSSGLILAASKSMRLKDGTVLAWAGTSVQGLVLADLYRRKQLAKHWPDFQNGEKFTFLVVARKGKVVFYEQQRIPLPVEVAPYAWGAGRELAIGAMAMGATAKQAVEIASRWEASCGCGVDNYLLL